MNRIIPIALFILLISLTGFTQKYYVSMATNSKWAQDFTGVTRIKVSWENPSPQNAVERQWVREAVMGTWGKAANIDFVGWDKYDWSNTGIRIFIDDYEWPYTDGLGTKVNGKYKGMVLNFNFLGEYKCDGFTKEYCIKAIAVHEFGHALGIAHEQDREDCGCNEIKKGAGGPVVSTFYYTPCDQSSVMNYCNRVWSNGGKLSEYDIKGIQAVYGIRKTTLDFEQKVGFSSLVDKLGPNQLWENLDFTLGDQKFIFNINGTNPEEIKSFTFVKSGFYSYEISSYSYHRDGKFYTGYGSGSLYIDNSKNYTIEVQAMEPKNGKMQLIVLARDIALETQNLFRKPTANQRLTWLPPLNVNFLRNGQKPIQLMLLDHLPAEKFYIYGDGTIMVYNKTTKTLIECGKKQAPVYKNSLLSRWAWSFYRTRIDKQVETFTISTTGEVWAYSNTGKFSKFGTIAPVDF